MKIEVADLKKVDLQTGEVLVLTAGAPFPKEAARELARAFPENRVLVLDAGTELRVVRP